MTQPPYRLIYHPELIREFKDMKERTRHDPSSFDAKRLKAGLSALDDLRHGREADRRGERLGFSPAHADLRDCAEIKVPVLQEHTKDGRARGPSHRMVYREFEGTADDPRPVREILSFEHRKNGRPFTVAAARLGRSQSIRVEALDHLGNITPAVGRRKDPNRPTGPVRLPLPPDLAAALATSPTGPPTRRHARAPSPTGRSLGRLDPPRQHRGR